MTKTNLEILNTTRYNTDDVIAVLKSAAGTKWSWTSVKIRYMIKPKKSWSAKKLCRWAKVESAYNTKHLEVGLLPPDKLGTTVLDRIALHEDEVSNQKVVNDLAYAMRAKVHYGADETYSTELTIRLEESEDEGARLLSICRNLRAKVSSETARLANNKARLVMLRAELAELEKSLPEKEKELVRLKNRLAKREQVLRVKELL